MKIICIIKEEPSKRNRYVIQDTDCCPNIKGAIQKAALDFLGMYPGKDALYWATFWEECPNVICEKYGFQKVPEPETYAVTEKDPLSLAKDCPVPYETWGTMADTWANEKPLVLAAVFQDSVTGKRKEASDRMLRVLNAKTVEERREALEQLRPYLSLEFLQQAGK